MLHDIFRMCICWLKVHHSDRECNKTVLVPRLNVLPDFNDMMLSYECNGIKFVRDSWFGSIRLQCTSLILEFDIRDAGTLSNGNSKFFGPSPRKQRLTVYRGLQVCSFGLESCVVQEFISLLHWIAAGLSRKSIWERLGQSKVSRMMIKMKDFMIRGR